MGKQVTYLTIIIFAELFFVATGQICAQGTCGIGSIIFNALLNLGQIPIGELFTQFLGDALGVIAGSTSSTGILALLGSGSVIIAAFVATKEFRILLIPVTLTLAVIAYDFVIIASYLISLNILLATFVMGPLMIIYIFTVVEWLIGKD